MPGLSDVLSAVSGAGGDDKLDSIYTLQPERWYQTLPYGFVFHDRSVTDSDPSASAPGSKVFYLPISPQNIQVNTHFATNVVTTLYGVVEEHSPVRYYDITISGTTGIAPKYVDEKSNAGGSSSPAGLLNAVAGSQNPSQHLSSGRSAFENNALDLGGFLPEVTNVINQARGFLSEADNLLNGGSKDTTGIDERKTGYFAFHNFYRYLLRYKNDAAGVGKDGNKSRTAKHSLQFLNYKDGVKYDCVPQSFTLTRSTENPFLYNYNIKMRCYNLRSVSTVAVELSQAEKLGFASGGTLEGNSVFSQAAGLASSAAGLVSGFI